MAGRTTHRALIYIMKQTAAARLIAFYLPQFHPTPENDAWWGKGFTEWTNVARAKPLFKGHYQPRLPGELGFYDLRIPEVRQAQADLAREYGVEGFCYWHYWFSGRRLLDRPFAEVLASGSPDFPFCLAWANETWRGFSFDPSGNRNILIEQTYDGIEEYTAHFMALLPAFTDKRYIRVKGKPLFMIYKPLADPEIKVFMATWQRLASEHGLGGIYFVGHQNEMGDTVDTILATGVDAVNTCRLFAYNAQRSFFKRVLGQLNKVFRSVRLVYPYRLVARHFIDTVQDSRSNVFPSIIPSWDHAPRSGRRAFVVSGSTPELFEQHVRQAVDAVSSKDPEDRLIFIKSWNEWAEGNYVEPDARWGRGYLEALGRAVKK